MTRRLITLLFIAAAITLLPWWLRGFAVALVLLRLSAYNATIARGLWLRLGCPRPHYITRLALPGLVLSDAEARLEAYKSELAGVDLGHQVQENPEEPLSPELIIAYLLTHPVDHKQATYIMTALKQSSGEWWASANKIRDAVGGNDTTIKAWVRDLRPSSPSQGSQGRWVIDNGRFTKVR